MHRTPPTIEYALRVAAAFDAPGRPVKAEPLPGGNINDTFAVNCAPPATPARFILQRINRNVFRAPPDVMANIRFVTAHIRERLGADSSLRDRPWRFPEVIAARAGGDLVVDDAGEFWRAMTCVEGARTHETARDDLHAREAGAALGAFHLLVSDIPPDALHDTLPGYHVTPLYLAQLDRAARADEGRRRLRDFAPAARCLEFVERRRGICVLLEDAAASGRVSTRAIHGDPKLANVMIDDASGLAVAIIDLDTVKPGLLQYDIGDCLRSACNPAGEDPADAAAVRFDAGLCAAILEGYIAKAAPCLTDADVSLVYESVRGVALEMAIRFLADFLAGDVYFKVRDPLHNLRRAAVQCRLCESIEAQEGAIRRQARSGGPSTAAACTGAAGRG